MNKQFWKDKKVLITGGAGFIGKNIIKKLIHLHPKSIICVDSFYRSDPDSYYEFEEEIFKEYKKKYNKFLDFNTHETCLKENSGYLESLFKNIDIVIHLASIVGSYQYYKQNQDIVGLNNMLIDSNVINMSLKYNVPYFFYASSTHVYQHLTDNSLKKESGFKEEDFQHVRLNEYDLSYSWMKATIEKLLEYNQHKFKGLSIGRLNGIYGEYSDNDLESGSIIPVMIRRCLEYPKIDVKILTSGEEKRSFLYVDDCIEMIFKMIELSEKINYQILNIGSGENISIKELSNKIIKVSNKDIKLNVEKTKAELMEQNIDCSECFLQLEYLPKYTLEEGLKKTYEYYEQLEIDEEE